MKCMMLLFCQRGVNGKQKVKLEIVISYTSDCLVKTIHIVVAIFSTERLKVTAALCSRFSGTAKHLKRAVEEELAFMLTMIGV